jgi:hypothetical protein
VFVYHKKRGGVMMDQKRSKNMLAVNKNKLGFDVFPMYRAACNKGAVPTFYDINIEVAMFLLQRDNIELPKQIGQLTELIMKISEGLSPTQGLILPEDRQEEYINERDIYDHLINEFLFFKGDKDQMHNIPFKGVW